MAWGANVEFTSAWIEAARSKVIMGGAKRRPDFAAEMARAGIEPATPRFSAVCSTN
jgi:hypothetical protein